MMDRAMDDAPPTIPVFEPDITEKEIRAVTEAITRREVSSSAPPVKRFEDAFAAAWDMKHAVAVDNGGNALFLTLKALGIKDGDEVIIPDYTMIATATAVSHCGAKPVFVDTAPGDVNIDWTKIEARVTPRTKAIIPVHVYGYPCAIDKIMEIAKAHNLYVVEDVAEAHGARFKGRLAGTFGTAACFSFHGAKILTTGEGGMIITNDDRLAASLRDMRGYSYAPGTYYLHNEITWNMRMSALEAALGLVQLERLEEIIGKKRRNAASYAEKLKEIPGLTFFPEREGTRSVFWVFGMLTPKRDDLRAFLAARGIETRPFFYPMHQQPPYREEGDYANSDHLCANGLYLPSSSALRDEQLNFVVGSIREFYRQR
jgi:perosamine synthetase